MFRYARVNNALFESGLGEASQLRGVAAKGPHALQFSLAFLVPSSMYHAEKLSIST